MNNPSHPFNTTSNTTFRDRRASSDTPGPPGVERRQFSNSHDDLSPPAAELAKAVDEYKVRHRRRFVTFEEVLSIITSLGYSRNSDEQSQ